MSGPGPAERRIRVIDSALGRSRLRRPQRMRNAGFVDQITWGDIAVRDSDSQASSKCIK